MYTVSAIADEILKQAKARGRQLTPLQLMKLVYISFGFYIAGTNQRLFPEAIEAWKFGPVMPDLYHLTKSWGRNPIPLDRISDFPSGIDEQTKNFLSQVVDQYSHLDGISLSNLTRIIHREADFRLATVA